ncbi:MAG: porin family protein [Prevotella sp.]|jgi:opacity protein-like surface antigen
MKKYLSLMLLAVSMMFAQQANAQLKFGIKGGLSVSKLSFDKEVFDSNNRTGWHLGPTVKLSFPIPALSVDASALYEQRSSKMEDNTTQSGETTVKQQAVIIPINLRYGFGLGSLASLFVFAGPQFGFNVGDRDFSWTSKENYENTFQLKKSNLSINVGAGASLIKHLQLTASYNIATGKTGEAKVWNVAENTFKEITSGKMNSWEVSLAYFF